LSPGRHANRKNPISSLAHHGHASVLSIAIRIAVRLACLLTGNRFSGYRFNAFRRAAAFYPNRDRSLVTAFPSPATASAFADSIPGSMVPACYFAVSFAASNARSAIRLRRRNWFAPIPAASSLQARCTS